MSFHTVRIKKNLSSNNNKSKKISFIKKIKKKSKKPLEKPLETALKKPLEKPLETTQTVYQQKKNKNIAINIIKKNVSIKKYVYNNFIPFNISKENLNSNHYIGVLIVNSISLNKLHNLKWDNLDNIYLNITRVLLCNNNKFPIIEIPLNDYQSGFKFKKFIKKTVISKWMINRKYIQGIKLLGNYGNIHMYTLIMNNTKFVKNKKFSKAMGKNFIWRNIFDQYKIQKDDIGQKKISQENIYKKILKNRNTSLVKYNLNLQPYLTNSNEDYPNKDYPNEDYLTKYLLDYEYILHQLSSFIFE